MLACLPEAGRMLVVTRTSSLYTQGMDWWGTPDFDPNPSDYVEETCDVDDEWLATEYAGALATLNHEEVLEILREDA